MTPQAEPQAPVSVVTTPAEPQVSPEHAADVAETNAVVAEKHDVDTVTPVSEAGVIDVTPVAVEAPAVSQPDTEVVAEPAAEDESSETVVPAPALRQRR